MLESSGEVLCWKVNYEFHAAFVLRKEQYNCERLEAVGLVCGRVQTDLDMGELSSINGGHFREKNNFLNH